MLVKKENRKLGTTSYTTRLKKHQHAICAPLVYWKQVVQALNVWSAIWNQGA